MRNTKFADDEYYHIYNRGVDKRLIFGNKYDLERFFLCMKEFNAVHPIGSIYSNTFKLSGPTSKLKKDNDPLVEFVAYCINPNHYHFILRQTKDGGISEFMKRLGGGYTRYFNDKHKRSGALFRGRYKFIHIDSNDYLLYVSAYVNLNNLVHKLSGPTSKLVKSSWEEYLGRTEYDFCNKEIVLEQFKSRKEYKIFANSVWRGAIENKKEGEYEKLFTE